MERPRDPVSKNNMYVYICKVFYKCYIFVKICLSCAVSSVLGEIKLNSEVRKQMAREGGEEINFFMDSLLKTCFFLIFFILTIYMKK